MAVNIVVAASVLRPLLTLTVPADTAVKKHRVIAAEKSRAMVARKNQATAVKNRAMAAKSLLIPLVATVVPKVSNMVVSALSDLMALLAFLVDSVEKRKSTARGGRSMAQVDTVALADMAMRVMSVDTKYDVAQAGCFMLMCCARSTMLTSP